jgi:hypothetical protein
MPARPSPWREEFGELQQVNWWLPVEVAEMLKVAASAYGLRNQADAAIIAIVNTFSNWQPGDNEAGELAKRTGLFPDA